MDPAERMQTLLRYANSAEVARGLTAAGYPVSGPTVSRWAKGRNVTPLAVRHVEDLLQTARNAPTPEWTQGLVVEVRAIRRVVEANADQLAILRTLLEARQAGLLPDGDDLADDPSPAQTGRRRGR